MAEATLAIANAILKDDYLGPLRSALNVATPIYDRVTKNSRDIVGRQAWIPVEMALSQAAGARAENAQLPDSDKGEYQELKVSLKHYYGSMSVTGPVLRQTAKGDRGAFARIVDVEAKGMKKLLSLVCAHDMYLGHTLATCTAEAGVNTLQLASNTNMQYFFKNMKIDVVLTSDGTKNANGDSLTITAVDKPNKTITYVGAAITTLVTEEVVREDTYGQTVTPLLDIIDNSTDIYGVTTSSFDEWKSTVDTSVGSFTVKKLQDTIDKIVIASGKYPTAIYSDYARQNKYFVLLTANPQYIQTTPPKVLDGGFRSLAYTGGGQPIPWIADRLMPAETLLLPHEPDLQFFSGGDWDFIEIGGDVWLPDILGSTPKDNFKAVLFRDKEMGAYNRNSHGKMTGVTD